MDSQLEDTLKILPSQPGVYMMKDVSDLIIYVGKAKILKNRVKSYFNGSKDIKTSVLVSKISRIDWIVTSTEFEALILENTLIKEHKPKYNINLKDGKTYPLIRITSEAFPRVFRTRKVIHDGSEYFGPFTDVGSIDVYLDLIEKHFPLRKCSGPLVKRDQPCLYYHIKKCGGPCIGGVSANEYDEQVDSVRKLLSGESEALNKKLEKQMSLAAKSLQFEAAAQLRDSMRAIQSIGRQQVVNDFDNSGRDYIAHEQFEDLICFSVLKMRDGKMVGNDTFRTTGLTENNELVEEFLLQYYDEANPPPAEIFCQITEDLDWWPHFAHDQFKIASRIAAPSSKRDSAIIHMAHENARQDLGRRKHEMGNVEALQEMQEVLELSKLPMRIEGFDIAQLHGKHTVAALVSFLKGRPDSKNYRIFNIKSLDGGIDDYQAISEAVARRYQKLVNEDRELPDLILIDGGRGQLNAAKKILDALGLEHLELASLAKQNEEIYRPHLEKPIVLPKGNPALRILQHVRDETHRFGTTRNQNLRAKTLTLKHLESVEGIGEKTAKALLETYVSFQAIIEAPLDELKKVGRLGEAKANLLKDHLKAVLEKPDLPKANLINYGQAKNLNDLEAAEEP